MLSYQKLRNVKKKALKNLIFILFLKSHDIKTFKNPQKLIKSSNKITNLNLSAVADSEYYERESSNVLINNRLGQNIFHMIRNDKDVLLLKVIFLIIYR